MLVRAGYDIGFSTDQCVPMLASLSLHASRNKDLRTSQRIFTQPDVPLYDYVGGFGNICTRPRRGGCGTVHNVWVGDFDAL